MLFFISNLILKIKWKASLVKIFILLISLNEFFNKNVYNWKDASFKNVTSQNIININTGNKNIKINKPINIKNKNTINFYVDFETINNHICNYDEYLNYNNQNLEPVKSTEMIYLIGVGYSKNDKWIFKSFLVNKLTYNQEIKIIKQWMAYMNKHMIQNKCTKMNIIHWTYAERRMLNTSCIRHKLNYMNMLDKSWIDLCKLFKDNIYIKDAFNYSLKSIAPAMYKHGFIKTKWEDDELNGLSTMIAIEYYNKLCNNLNKHKDVKKIIKYNEIDCKVMWELCLL